MIRTTNYNNNKRIIIDILTIIYNQHQRTKQLNALLCDKQSKRDVKHKNQFISGYKAYINAKNKRKGYKWHKPTHWKNGYMSAARNSKL